MTIRPGLLANIQATLSAAISPNLTVGSQGDDLYEAYIWSVIINAAQNKGATIEFKDVFGNTVSANFTFAPRLAKFGGSHKTTAMRRLAFQIAQPWKHM